MPGMVIMAEDAAWQPACVHPVAVEHDCSVDDHGFDAGRIPVRLGERGGVDNRLRVPNGDVRPIAGSDEATLGQAETVGGKAGHLPDRLLESQYAPLAHIPPEDAREGAVGTRVWRAMAQRAIWRERRAVRT